MSEMNPKLSSLEREKALFLYSVALERGDDATIELTLQMAGQDPLLEEMIFDMHDLEAAQEMQNVDEAAAAKVRELASLHLPSASFQTSGAEVEELPPVTVAQVIARLQSDAVSIPQMRELTTEIAQVTRQTISLQIPIPPQLNQKTVAHLLKNLGVRVSSQFEKCFRETALFLNMGRQQNQAQLAATRRQRKASPSVQTSTQENAQEENSTP